MNRRDSLRAMGSLALLPLLSGGMETQAKISTKIIPSTGESLPVIGLGTWQTFDVAADEDGELKKVLQLLIDKGGKVVDSSPMYGRSEKMVGALSREIGINKELFVATKVWTTGKDNGVRQMNESFRLLQRPTIDLMQIHNLTDWKTHLSTLREWKEKGRLRYIGVTHYLDSAHDDLARIIKSEKKVDFIQVNYNLLDRHAAERLLPLAADEGIAVLINRPFEEGELFSRVKGKPLPPWTNEFDCNSWGQFFLKYILSHPAVTCVIPGTSKTKHLLDNLGAGFGKLPTPALRERMEKVI